MSTAGTTQPEKSEDADHRSPSPTPSPTLMDVMADKWRRDAYRDDETVTVRKKSKISTAGIDCGATGRSMAGSKRSADVAFPQDDTSDDKVEPDQSSIHSADEKKD